MPGAGPALLAATLAFTVLAAWRPAITLALMAAGLPVTAYVSGYAGVRAAWTEPLVVAALVGWSIRVVLGLETYAPPADSRRPWTLLGWLIVASAIVELAVEAIYLASSPWPILRFLYTGYFADRASYPSLGAALLLLEGLALFAWVSAVTREEDRWRLVIGMLAVGGAIGAALNLARFIEIARRTGLQAVGHTSTLRVNVLHGDVNAAASYFVLILALACGLALGRRLTAVWIIVAGLCTAALWVTGSRTAIGIAALIGGMVLVAIAWRATARRVRAVAVMSGLALVAALAVAYRQYPEKFTGKPAEEALRVRKDMWTAGLRMTAAHPWFGIGIGRFYSRSPEFMPSPVASEYAHENAHNNFLQVLAELGVAGLAAFIWLLATALIPSRDGLAPSAPMRSETGALRIGVVGFLLTCLMGHPLLVREVAYPFWMALGLVAARTRPLQPLEPVPGTRRRWVESGVAVLLIATVPVRIVQHSRDIDLEEIASGVSTWERDASGAWVRHVSANATFYVSGDAPLVEIPLRLTTAGRETTVLIVLDGKPANMIALQDDAWRSTRVVLPEGPHRRFRRIDLSVEPPASELVMGRLRYAGWK